MRESQLEYDCYLQQMINEDVSESNAALEQPITFLPALPEAQRLAKRTWASDPAVEDAAERAERIEPAIVACINPSRPTRLWRRAKPRASSLPSPPPQRQPLVSTG